VFAVVLAGSWAAVARMDVAQQPAPRQDVDATTFLLAHRDGTADKYRGFRVTGVAPTFRSLLKQTDVGRALTAGHGAPTHVVTADPVTVQYAVLTIGAVRDAAPPALLRDWEAWREADKAAQTLDVLLALKSSSPTSSLRLPPATYSFSGIYTGTERLIDRVTLGAAPHECHAPASHAGRTHTVPVTHAETHSTLVPGYEKQRYCVPLLEDAELK
jgi:hypothetical protein